METKHTLPTGEEMTIEVNKFFGATIMLLKVNFNPYEHAQLGYISINCLPGIKTITGIQSIGKKSGQFSYLLRKNADITEITNDTIEQFSNYFIKF